MDASRLILGVVFLILILSPDNTANVSNREYDIKNIIAEERRWLGELQNSTYGHVGNLTGFANNDWWSPNGMGLVRTAVSHMIDDVFNRARSDDGYKQLGNILYDTPIKKRAVIEAPPSPPEGPAREVMPEDTPSPEEYQRVEPVGLNPLEGTLNEAPIYRNITGMLSGNWNRMDMPDLFRPTINETYQRNITLESGRFWMIVKEKQPKKQWEELKGVVQMVTLNMELYNEQGGRIGSQPADVRMHGIHFVESGLLIGASNSNKFAGIFGLPHLTPSNTTYNLVKKPLNASLSAQVNDHLESGDEYPPWIPVDEQYIGTPPLQCEFIIYLQIHPIKMHPDSSWFTELSQQAIVDTIEREFRHRTGEYVPIMPPPLVGSAIIYSPDCSFVLSTQSATGVKLEQYFDRVSNFGLNACLVVAFEIYFMIRQMKESSTPSTLSRVSFWTIGILSLLDGYIVIIFIVTATLIERSSLTLLAAAFFCTVLAGFFGIRYMLMIYRVQLPERRAAQAASTPATPSPAAAAAQAAAARATASGGLPLPVTTPVATPPVVVTTTQPTTTVRQDFSSIITRFYMFLVITGFLLIYSMSLPLLVRNFIQRVALFLSLSFWVPQIYRNTYRNCRKGLKWEFVFGMSACRLIAVLYFYGYTDNIAFAIPVKWICWASVGWVWVQIWMLGVQELLGPRFLVPEGWLPPAYDYYPILPADDLERALPGAGSPVVSPSKENGGGSSGTSGGIGGRASGKTHKVFDCAICMQSVEVPVQNSSSGGLSAAVGADGRGNGDGNGVVGLLGQNVYVGRRSYMVTPCRHVFHSGCLEGWMRVRLQCPICRNTLPPI
ncbi:hypothetical protein H072_10588 [Dactylellina haptotyla CBS 200.50]|uniref:DSC E3 ubiquitin ligase complex subunit A n=1 Tax=Dactylellina haptotyla (strain CBS 200.50) TaxID=1284197 RepID=S8BA24_DACHA|nr:hypothetical protein H072_10588 [Dactylellina haptotyla CBS 200.50]